MGNTTMRYEVVSKLLSNLKVKMKLEGDDYVLGEAMIAAVGWRAVAGASRMMSTNKGIHSCCKVTKWDLFIVSS